MATLPTKSFAQIVTNTIAGIQGRASKLINFSIGSTLRAIVEGFAGLFLWFQTLVLELLKAMRLSTATGIDVDTFTADFMPVIAGSQTAALPGGSPRLGSQSATGTLTFARFTAAPSTCFIPAASKVDAFGNITNAGVIAAATAQTADGSEVFVVIADTTNPNYSASLGGYTLASSVASIDVAVQAKTAGIGGNVLAGSINTMTAPISGIDTVTNAADFFNGANQEGDSALKKRFADYILGLSRGDFYGLNASIEGTDVTVQWTLTELYNYDGSYRPGYFFVVADDGSGTPPASFLTLITNAANAVRPLGIMCSVFAPVVIKANVSMILTTVDGYDHDTVVAQVSAAVATNINELGLGNDLPWSLLSSWAYAVPGVKVVSSVLLNGVSGDSASIQTFKYTGDRTTKIAYATVKAGTMTIS